MSNPADSDLDKAAKAEKARKAAIGPVQTFDPFTGTWRVATTEEAEGHVESPSVSLPETEG